MIILGTTHLLDQIVFDNLPIVKIGSVNILIASSVKSLGVIIDSSLT